MLATWGSLGQETVAGILICTGSIAATSEIGQIFCGRLRSQVVCAECAHRSPSYESFFDLSLELRKAGSVGAALKQFTASEKLHGANRYRCPACSKLVNATKQLLLHRTPHVLALQLKRFGFGRYGGGKISRPIPFEEAIDLSPYCTAEAKRAASVRYRLYGVLVHEGPSVHAGHYYPGATTTTMSDQITHACFSR